MSVDERARAGLFLSFQSPPDVPGVKNNLFIRTALNAQRKARGEVKAKIKEARNALPRDEQVALLRGGLGHVLDGARNVLNRIGSTPFLQAAEEATPEHFVLAVADVDTQDLPAPAAVTPVATTTAIETTCPPLPG